MLEKLRDNLSKITNSNKTVIIAGDFNYDILKYEYNKYINDFLNIMYFNFLQPCIREPIRIVGNNRPALINNIFINTYNKNVNSGNVVSDHMPNFVIIRDIFDKKKPQKLLIRDMKNFNKEQYLKDLENIKNLDIIQYKSTNDMFNTFHTALLQIIDKNTPYKTRSKSERKIREKTSITESILQSIKIKNELYSKYIQKQDKFWYELYKYYRNKINILIKKSKRNHLRSYFQSNLANSKLTWNKINNILSKRTKKHFHITINENGITISDQKVVANYFTNVAKNLLKDLGKTNNKYQDYLKNPSEHSFFLKEVTPDEVCKWIQKLDIKKANDISNTSKASQTLV